MSLKESMHASQEIEIYKMYQLNMFTKKNETTKSPIIKSRKIQIRLHSVTVNKIYKNSPTVYTAYQDSTSGA